MYDSLEISFLGRGEFVLGLCWQTCGRGGAYVYVCVCFLCVCWYVCVCVFTKVCVCVSLSLWTANKNIILFVPACEELSLYVFTFGVGETIRVFEFLRGCVYEGMLV